MTECEKAKAWRERLDLTQVALSQLTGYSHPSIYWFEQGVKPPTSADPTARHPITSWVFLRYKRACGDVDAERNGRAPGAVFNW